MTLAAAVDWTQVLIVGVPAYIAAVGGAIAAVLVALNRRSLRTGNGHSIGALVRQTRERTEDLKTPSGDSIGAVAERTHDITHATNVLVRKVNGIPPEQPADEVA